VEEDMMTKTIKYNKKKVPGRKGKIIEKNGEKMAFLESIFNAITDGVTVIDSNCNIIFINQSLAHFYGYKYPKDIIGKKCYEIFEQRKRKCKPCQVTEILDTKKPQHMLHSRKDRHGNETYWELHFFPILDDKGKVVRVVEYSRNITREKKLEEEVKESERRLADLLSVSRDIIAEIMECTFISKNVKDFAGYTAKEILSAKSFFDFLTPESKKKCIKYLKNRIAGKPAPELYEFEILHKNGDVIPVEARVALRKEGKKVIGTVATVRDIAERKHAEEALRESEKRYRNLFEKSPISITLLDKTGIIIDCNKSTEKLIGYTKKEILGKSFEKLLTLKPEDLPKLKEKYTKLLKGQKIKPYKLEIIRKDGKKSWINVTTSLIEKEDEVVGFQVISRDITERELAEEALRESEELYRTFVETSPDAIAFTDLDANIIMISPKGLEDLGYDSPEELIGKSAFDLMAPKDRPRITKNFQEIIETGQARNVEFNFLRKDGTKVPVEFNASLILDEKGEPKAFLGISRDITERRKVEEARKESEEKYSNLFHESNDAIIIHDLKGNIVDANQRVSDIFGFSRKEVMKLQIPGLHPPNELEKSKKAFKKISKQGHVNFEINFKKKNGEVFPAEVSSGLFEIGGKKVIQGIVRDITERKKAEEALRESEEKFRNLAEQSPNMIFINQKGKVVYANQKGEEEMGYTKEEFYSPDFDFFSLIAPESIDLVKKSFSRHKKDEEVPSYEYTLITRGGKRIEAINTTKMISYGGEPAILGIVTDITERKHAEEEIKELKEFSESIVESMNEGIMILDGDGYVSFINPKIEKMLGYKRTKLVGEHWSDVIAPDYHRRMRDCYAENLRGEHDRFEAVLIKKNRTELPVLISAAPQIKDDAFNGVLAVITDISERKREEIEREELMRYKIRRGSTYLIEEKELDKGKDVVYELYKNHFNGVIVTREHPDKIKRDIDLKLPLYWMTNDPRDKMSVKPEFPLLEKIIDDNIDRNTFVFLDRFDYLVTQNSFKEALNFIQHLNETFYARKAILIISLDPETLNAQELSLLEKETSILEKRHEVRLSADLLDLLEFVNNRNRVGESPSYKQVGDEFRISRTTARKRISELIYKGLLMEKKSGRFKYLILTEKGKESL
jgi:PAS domain S-box-containing protein